jgi:hypothetical protein
VCVLCLPVSICQALDVHLRTHFDTYDYPDRKAQQKHVFRSIPASQRATSLKFTPGCSGGGIVSGMDRRICALDVCLLSHGLDALLNYLDPIPINQASHQVGSLMHITDIFFVVGSTRTPENSMFYVKFSKTNTARYLKTALRGLHDVEECFSPFCVKSGRVLPGSEETCGSSSCHAFPEDRTIIELHGGCIHLASTLRLRENLAL